MKKKAKDKPHYVDNKKFLQAMIDWRETWPDENNIPPVTNYIGECFLKIATHLSYRPNFINYTYRDEMISDGIENCLQYVKNFNPEKSQNPNSCLSCSLFCFWVRPKHPPGTLHRPGPIIVSYSQPLETKSYPFRYRYP